MNLILGSGWNAFILKCIFPKSKIVSFKKFKTPPLFHIHYTEKVLDFLQYVHNNYGFHYELVDIKVGCIDRDFNLIDKNDIEKYLPIYRQKSKKFGNEKIMNNLNFSYKAFKPLDSDEKYDDFLSDNCIKGAMIEVVNANEVCILKRKKECNILSNQRYKYIFSTIPLPELAHKYLKYGIEGNFQTFHKAWEKINPLSTKYKKLQEFNSYEYIYDMSPDTDTIRYIKINHSWYGEKVIHNDNIVADYILPNCVIQQSMNNVETLNGIQLVGRYAQWNNKLLTHHTIERFW